MRRGKRQSVLRVVMLASDGRNHHYPPSGQWGTVAESELQQPLVWTFGGDLLWVRLLSSI